MKALLAGAGLAVIAAAAGAAKEIVLPPETARLKESPLLGYAIASGMCVLCHSADYVQTQPPALPLKFWTAEVAKMKKVYGAPIPSELIDPIAAYLTQAYGVGPPASLPANPGEKHPG